MSSALVFSVHELKSSALTAATASKNSMQAIDLKHAKETALKNAQKMIDEKL
jgi:hypothetical protein